MKSASVGRWAMVGLLSALMLQAPGWAAAQTTFGRIVVFGDSLSDPGNAFALFGETNTPPYDLLSPILIPDRPYAKGGQHFSNGATWVEQLARPLGLGGNTMPAFQGAGVEATNYAVGGARAYDDGINVNLPFQVNTFLNVYGGTAPSDALYVVEFGGNDIRDALTAYASGADGSAVIANAVNAIGTNMGILYAAGARKFFVWNAPDLSVTPAVRRLDVLSPGAGQLASALTIAFNTGVDAVVGSMEGLPGIEIVRLDIYQILNDLMNNHAEFGLSVVDAACVTPDAPPFDCRTPDKFLFWDGIHPTATVHAIISRDAADALAK